jgi:hypothetical protein
LALPRSASSTRSAADSPFTKLTDAAGQSEFQFDELLLGEGGNQRVPVDCPSRRSHPTERWERTFAASSRDLLRLPHKFNGHSGMH